MRFFFQAEDGIRDWSVTGVQTCALPIYGTRELETPDDLQVPPEPPRQPDDPKHAFTFMELPAFIRLAERFRDAIHANDPDRSEERRVGKEGRLRWEATTQQYRKRGHR